VVDVGASSIDGDPSYQALRVANKMDLVAFEPDEKQYAALDALSLPRTKAIQCALGDGTPGILNICKSPGMGSLLEPQPEVLAHFHGFPEWGTVVEKQPVSTRRLDDVPEFEGCHSLKRDVQGGELPIFPKTNGPFLSSSPWKCSAKDAGAILDMTLDAFWKAASRGRQALRSRLNGLI
jgi:FkbM family methyltransferase